MLYNVAQLLKEAVGASRRYEISEVVEFPDEGWGGVRPTGSISMLRTPTGILVQGQLQVALTEQCGRCLEPCQQMLAAEIEEEFWPVADVNTGLVLKVPDGEDIFTINERHLLDLTEALRQAIWVARPLQPLCQPDCKGLCPNCGQDRNQDECRCNIEDTDPRWAALKKLLA
jgi:uncharacterized protein